MNIDATNLPSQLGKLEKVDIREIWKKEAKDFTTWLAREDNLTLLSDEIGISMNLIKTEAGVGKFSADILAEESNTGRKIVIENQLEQTDHDHFGKLFTYGSGLDAGILIWICKHVREEHRQAIDWLNEKTDNTLQIFVIKMEAWKIDDSKPAPKFQIICSPNDWARTVKDTSIDSNKLSETNLRQLDFWTEFNTYMSENNPGFKSRKPQPQHWYDIAIGSSQAHISLTISFSKNFIRSELYMPDNKDLFQKLANNKDAIEKDLDLSNLSWNALPKAKASSISIRKTTPPLKDDGNWASCFEWYAEIIKKFNNVFPKYF
jgi:hypothetical protein